MSLFNLFRKPPVPSCPENLTGHEQGCIDDRCLCTHQNLSPIEGSTDVWCHDCEDRLT